MALYKANLVGADGSYKDRIQDYSSDKKFDNKYADREVGNFDFIHGKKL
jgi:hypothetical protein